MANKPTADKAPADTSASDATATAVVADPTPSMSSARPSGKSRWVLASVAGVGILSLGLLGGILIGQHLGPAGGNDRGPAAHITIEHQQSGARDQIPDRLRERLQDIRDNRLQAPNQGTPNQGTRNQQAPSQPAPNESTPPSNG